MSGIYFWPVTSELVGLRQFPLRTFGGQGASYRLLSPVVGLVAVFSVRMMVVMIFAVVSGVRRMVMAVIVSMVPVVMPGVRDVAVVIRRVVSVAGQADREERAQNC